MKASSPILSIVLGRTTSPEISDSLNALSAIPVTGTPSTEEGIIRDVIPFSYPTTSYPDFVFLNKLRERLNFLIKGKFISDCSIDYVAHSRFIYQDKRKTDKEIKEKLIKKITGDAIKDYSIFNKILNQEAKAEVFERELDEFSFKNGIDI